MSVRMIRRRRQTKSQPDQPLGMTGAAKIVRGALIWSPIFPNVLTGRRTIAAASEGAYAGAPVGAAGLGRKWTRSTNAGVSFGSAQAITQQSGVTVLVVAAPSSAAALKVPFSQRIASGAYTQTDFVFNSVDTGMISTATAGAAMLASYHNAGTGVAANGQVDGKMHCWVAGNGVGNGYIYRDGKKQTLAASTRTPAVLSAAGQQLRIGNIANDTATTWVHDDPLYLVIVWDRLLHEAEAASLSANHRQIERRRRRRVFRTSAAGSTLNASATGAARASGTAQPETRFALAGVGISTSNGGAQATSVLPLSAAALAISGGNATATASIALNAAGLAQAAAQAGLSPAIILAGAAAAQAAGNAALAAQLQALAAGTAQADGTATLSSVATRAASGSDTATGQAALSITITLIAAGAAASVGSASANLLSQGAIVADGKSVASGSATPTLRINASAAGQGQASGTASAISQAAGNVTAIGSARAAGSADCTLTATLTAAGFIQAMGAGQLAIEVPLAALGSSAAHGAALIVPVPDYIPVAPLSLHAAVVRLANLHAVPQRFVTLQHKVQRDHR